VIELSGQITKSILLYIDQIETSTSPREYPGHLTSTIDPGGGNLTPYGRGRGDLKKLPRNHNHGEARRREETTLFFVTLWLAKKGLGKLCVEFEGKYKQFCL